MVTVRLWGSLAELVDGKREIEITATNLRELLEGLAEAYPALKPQISRGVSVAIDGRIYNDTWATPINETSEVVLLNRLVGG
ncbi:MAG: MoaD/ThiS family protein [Tateyamaria sp.]|jgi:molybdopterin synthase sulfur carrier subunit|nr:MoaD/ThiS family protein [Tateyamaria sp.]MDG0982490.1 MoaD/ThiS family protein [Tateyamaria sp.]MDG1420809.1 MoaD/ThiS family protein [Tateyamaria sp.]MDG1677917.1 MoaD/ThiS family protein [Tateyamaria sp.]MDG1986901.1 MoaD/ThiS family protein [Halieaceae bacterium]